MARYKGASGASGQTAIRLGLFIFLSYIKENPANAQVGRHRHCENKIKIFCKLSYESGLNFFLLERDIN